MSAAAAVAVLALVPARAAAPVAMEKNLLGIRILQTYKDVLARLGQPKVIVTGGEGPFRDRAVDPSGNFVGAIQNLSYSESGSTGGGGGGMMGAKGGGMMSMASMGPMGPMTGGGGGPMGMGKKGDGGGGGGPAMPGGGPGTGGMTGGGGSSASSGSFKDGGGYAWWYHNRFDKTAYSFYFNLEGRVLGILEEGVKGGTPTARGIKLGSTLKDLYTTYGWPDTIEEGDPGFILDYGSKYHVKFAVIKEKVVGIGVVLNETQPVPFIISSGSSSSGGAAGGGKMGGGGGAVGGAPTKGGVGGFAPRNPGGVGGASSHSD